MKTLLDQRILNAAAVATERARAAGGYAALTPAESAQMISIGREGAGRNQQDAHARLQANRAALGSLRDDAEAAAAVREEIAHAMLVTLKREHAERERIRNRARDGVWYLTFPPLYEQHQAHVEAVAIVDALATAFGISPPPIRWCRELTATEAETQLRAGADNLLHEKSHIGACTDGVTVTLNESLLDNRSALIDSCAHEVFHMADMTAPEDDARMFGTTFVHEYHRRFSHTDSSPGPADLAEIAGDFVSAERTRK